MIIPKKRIISWNEIMTDIHEIEKGEKRKVKEGNEEKIEGGKVRGWEGGKKQKGRRGGKGER
jgi:hypothetical protein